MTSAADEIQPGRLYSEGHAVKLRGKKHGSNRASLPPVAMAPDAPFAAVPGAPAGPPPPPLERAVFAPVAGNGELLTSARARSVLFAVTEKGYYFPQVEKFAEDTAVALEAAEAAIAEKTEEVNRLIAFNLNLESTIAVFKGAGVPQTDAQGNMLTEGQLAESRQAVAEQDGAAGDRIRVRTEPRQPPIIGQVLPDGRVAMPGF